MYNIIFYLIKLNLNCYSIIGKSTFFIDINYNLQDGSIKKSTIY
jgi:hypothetical protein